MAYRLEQTLPQSMFTTQLQNTSPLAWVRTNYGYASFIYNLSQDTKPSPAYYQEGQVIAKTQLVLAGYRLAQFLNHTLISE
jgi:hypothetical protein